jgi:hypothetical protein
MTVLGRCGPHRFGTANAVAAAVFLSLLGLLIGCTGEHIVGSDDGRDERSDAGRSEGATTPASGPSSTPQRPPATFATPLPDAAEIVSALAVPFGWSAAEAGCVAADLPAETLDAARRDALSPNSAGWAVMSELGERCWQRATWAPAMVEAASEALGRPLTASEAACAQGFWAELPAADLEAVTAQAVVPSNGEAADRVVGALNAECGL